MRPSHFHPAAVIACILVFGLPATRAQAEGESVSHCYLTEIARAEPETTVAELRAQCESTPNVTAVEPTTIASKIAPATAKRTELS